MCWRAKVGNWIWGRGVARYYRSFIEMVVLKIVNGKVETSGKKCTC